MTKEERENDCFGKLIMKNIPPMSTKQAIEVLHELDGSLYETQQVALDLAIKALEQQPSDDCVSRKAVLNAITEIDGNINMDIYTNEVREIIKDLPPVTPTHGTCKDCTNYVVGALDEEICIRGHELIHKDFYCADYKKRGNEE